MTDRPGDKGWPFSTMANTATVLFYPPRRRASLGATAGMPMELDRWLADEIDELAASIGDLAGPGSTVCATEVHEMAARLIRHAERLGYPRVVETAGRLSVAIRRAGGGAHGERSELDSGLRELLQAIDRPA